MNVSTWLELAGLIVGGGGGGTAIARLTRLIVAVETLTRQMETIVKDARQTAGQVQDHEIRLGKAGL